MKSTLLLSGVLALPFLSQALAKDLEKRSPSNPLADKTCQDYSIPLNISSTIFVASYPRFEDNFDAVNWVNQLARYDSATAFHPFNGTKNAIGAYSIGATFCTPAKPNANQKTVLLATHGLGFDRRYWNSEYEAANYSFVDAAISHGYSVFFYDRLGTGSTSKVSGYEEPQSSTQLEILKQLTTLVKSGKYTGAVGRPSKVAHIGHSFGSFLSHALIATTPELSDGAIITGIGYNKTALAVMGSFVEAFALRIATKQEPGRWEGRDNEYLGSADISGQAATFFHGRDFDKKALWYAETIKQPLATAELLTTSTVIPNITSFTGPVMVISGQYDLGLCGGNCDGVLEHPAAEIFSKAKNFQAVSHPGSGHGINLNYNATGAYTVILDYLKANL